MKSIQLMVERGKRGGKEEESGEGWQSIYTWPAVERGIQVIFAKIANEYHAENTCARREYYGERARERGRAAWKKIAECQVTAHSHQIN